MAGYPMECSNCKARMWLDPTEPYEPDPEDPAWVPSDWMGLNYPPCPECGGEVYADPVLR